jgi:Flp pilus assembly protein TadG
VDDIFRWCRHWLPDQTRHSTGNIALYMALLLTSLVGLAGAGVDYGLNVVETSRLQNAVDAASLAGARALVTSTGSTQATRNTEGATKAKDFLGLHNYTVGTLPTTDTNETANSVTWACRSATDAATSTTFKFCGTSSDDAAGAINDTMKVTGTVVKPTRFWRIIGINSTTVSRESTAVASGGMVDVMLSLDLSRSMDINDRGTQCNTYPNEDVCQLQKAVVAFINQLQIDSANPRGTQLGIARWAGVKCSWWRGGAASNNQGADTDNLIDWGIGPPGSGDPRNRSEYTTPCSNDATIITGLTNNKARLLKIANNSGTGTCPTGMTPYACPLQTWDLPISQIPVIHGAAATATGTDNNTVNYGGTNYNVNHNWSGITGTRLPNAIQIVSNGSYYAWSTANGGRNDAATTGVARKVLVLMTDGFSQLTADEPSNPPDVSTWDDEAITLAQTLELGPDGIAGTVDDVEVFVVGFFPVPYSSSTSDQNWARSMAANYGTVDGSPPHPCPNATIPTVASNRFSYLSNAPSGIDEVLNKIASSKAGSCDHYYPIAKSEGSKLPQLFRVLAGSIARGRLQ